MSDSRDPIKQFTAAAVVRGVASNRTAVSGKKAKKATVYASGRSGSVARKRKEKKRKVGWDSFVVPPFVLVLLQIYC